MVVDVELRPTIPPTPTAPSATRILELLRGWSSCAPTFDPSIGLEGARRGFDLDEASIRLGAGREVFERARVALGGWRHFPRSWTRILPEGASVRVGIDVAVIARVAGLWWVNPCRVVDRVDRPERFAFRYVTLPGHVEDGLEEFAVEVSDGRVEYRLRAVSRPRHPLARLAYPLARAYQARFRRDSLEAMRAAVAEEGDPDDAGYGSGPRA